jgi:hypothetical protein
LYTGMIIEYCGLDMYAKFHLKEESNNPPR